jgi:hypothetical protein
MNVVDALLFAILAAGDMAFIVHLRKRRARHVCEERMARCLAEAVRRELQSPTPRRRAGRSHPVATSELVPSIQ